MNHHTSAENTTLIPAEELAGSLEVISELYSVLHPHRPLSRLREYLLSRKAPVQYEPTVLALASDGCYEEAIALMAKYGPTGAKLTLSGPNDQPTHIPSLIWPGHIEVVGNFRVDSLIAGGDIRYEGVLQAMTFSCGGAMRARVLRRAAQPFCPRLVPLRSIPSLGYA